MLKPPILLFFVLFLIQCTSPQPPLDSYFSQALPTTDTVLIAAEASTDTSSTTIPYQDMQAAMDLSLFDDHPFGQPDSVESKLIGHWKFRPDEEHIMYLLEYQWNWFISYDLLVWSETGQQFTSRQSAAIFYGGDGGQIRTTGRLFDWNAGSSPSLLIRRVDHGLIPQGDTLLEYADQYVSLLKWDSHQFQEMPLVDSASWIEAYPLDW